MTRRRATTDELVEAVDVLAGELMRRALELDARLRDRRLGAATVARLSRERSECMEVVIGLRRAVPQWAEKGSGG